MARKVMTLTRFEEIKRRLQSGHKIKRIARDLGVCPKTVRRIREDKLASPSELRPAVPPAWSERVNWSAVVQEIRFGAPVKFLWEDHAKKKVTYTSFLRQLHRRHPELRQASVTLRCFNPGDQCEVDYAGKTLEYYDTRNREFIKVPVFIGKSSFRPTFRF